MIYITKDNEEIKTTITKEDEERSFKLNLSEDIENYLKGNGEGVWACCSKKDYDAMEANTPIKFIAKILNDSVYYPGLEFDTLILAEYRGGGYRPLAVLDELQSKYEYSEENKNRVINELRKRNRVSCNECYNKMQ